MRGIEFFRNVSIGQYRPGTSYAHRLTPATKYLWLLALMVSGIASSSYLGALLPLAAALAIGAVAGIRPSFLLRGIKPFVPLIASTAVLQALFPWPGDASRLLVSLGPIAFTANKARIVLMMFARTLSLMTVIGLFTSVTSEGESVHGIEDILDPLRFIGRAVSRSAHRLALAVGIALRFVPIIVGELEAIAKAQASRGADFGSGRGGPIAKARAYLPLFVPVTVRALERAELLAEAMEARGYTGEGRTRLVSYPKQRGEGIARLAALAVCAMSFILDHISRSH
ncbi:MAG: energy-coupling factor transporter transmembrane component T [Rectinemataceae bacterium]